MHSSSLRLFYANLRSIRKACKFDEIKCIIKTIPKTTHLLIFTETWITSEDDAKLYELTNYKHIYNFRKNKKGGGVSIYVHNSIKSEVTEEISQHGNHYLWIHIDKLSLNIGAIYKPGETNLNNFIDIYSAQLEQRRRTIVLGDFNIDLLSKNCHTTKYLSEIEEAGYEILNKINKKYCTRETSTTHTILDHVCTNLKNHSFSISIIESSLSDHKQIYIEIGKLVPKPNKIIHYKALDYEKLYNNALKTNYSNCEHDYYYLEDHILKMIDKNKIDKTKFVNLPQNEWVNKSIIDSINLRNSLWQESKLKPEDKQLQNFFLQEQHKVKTQIKKNKKSYYINLFYKNYSHPKKMWEIINSLALNKNKDSCAPPKLMSSSRLITEGTEICNLFNSFFTSIGMELANKIPYNYHINSGNSLMYEHNSKHEITLNDFSPCHTHEVSQIIHNLNNNTSTGLDGISTKAIKCLKNVISDRLTKCINKCLKEGIFPDTLKIAKVSPIYKSGSRSDPNNYRPVSVLPVMSKIFERILYTRLNTYLTKKKFLIPEQYGFRPKSRTLTAAMDLITKIKTNIDKKYIALGIFIDLKKAFDTVSHQKLLQKLKNIGITGKAHNMFASYLQNRSQIVKIGDFTSSKQNVNFGCPQGSIISPLMFLIYINNINKIGLTGHLTLYADDTCLFYFGKSIHNIVKNAQTDLDKLNEWFKFNLLTINTSKTTYMIFKAKNKHIPDFTPLSINNTIIQVSHREKYLGLWIDDKLTWKSHINHVKNKLTSLLGTLRKTANCIPKKVSTIIYNSLVKSHLEYLIEIWGSAATTNLKQLQRTQNKIIKVLFHYPYLTPTVQLYKKTNFLDLRKLYIYSTCILIRNITTNSIKSNIQLHKKVTSHKLRNKYKIQLPKVRTSYGKKTILFEGAQLYNKLPNYIKECKTLNMYKHELKKYLQINIM